MPISIKTKNRLDKEQLEIFHRCYEAILNAMFVESSVLVLRSYIRGGEAIRWRHILMYIMTKDNGVYVGVDVTGITENDVESIKAYVGEKLSLVWVSEELCAYSKTYVVKV